MAADSSKGGSNGQLSHSMHIEAAENPATEDPSMLYDMAACICTSPNPVACTHNVAFLTRMRPAS